MPTLIIREINLTVEKLVTADSQKKRSKRGNYMKYNDKERADIANDIIAV